jgi:hypothetical protein
MKGQQMQHDFILLDRSGSMQVLWSEAINSVNAYVKKLGDDKVDTGVTLATFDKDGEQFKFEVIRDRIIPSTWKPVSAEDATPRGSEGPPAAAGPTVRTVEGGACVRRWSAWARRRPQSVPASGRLRSLPPADLLPRRR